MSVCLGLDTSNYTTSTAIWQDGAIHQVKRLLPVKPGELGLRQSDAVFHHVRQLPDIVEELRGLCDAPITAIAASDRPQQREGSYMPCFLAGMGAARELAAVLHVPCYRFTHQQGHVAAALFGSERTAWIREPFLAFHVSGGTTDALLVRPDKEDILRCETVGRSRDLKAGQLIDRVGGLLGLPFPAGPALEKLASRAPGWGSAGRLPRPSLEGADCHLSGVENQCRTMKEKGAPDEEVALFCLRSVLAAVSGMTQALLRVYGNLPVVYAGGVMSNSLLRRELEAAYNGTFAPPAYSADNAAGIALLCSLREKGAGRL